MRTVYLQIIKETNMKKGSKKYKSQIKAVKIINYSLKFIGYNRTVLDNIGQYLKGFREEGNNNRTV
jgi:hypothetical protein